MSPVTTSLLVLACAVLLHADSSESDELPLVSSGRLDPHIISLHRNPHRGPHHGRHHHGPHSNRHHQHHHSKQTPSPQDHDQNNIYDPDCTTTLMGSRNQNVRQLEPIEIKQRSAIIPIPQVFELVGVEVIACNLAGTGAPRVVRPRYGFSPVTVYSSVKPSSGYEDEFKPVDLVMYVLQYLEEPDY